MRYVNLAVGIVVAGGVLFMFVGGAIPLAMGLRGVWRGLASSRWPTAPGTVLKAAMAETEAARREGTYTLATYTFYAPKLSFGYRVNGRDYTTENLQFGRAQASGDASETVLMLLRYPVGAKVPVHYHPSDPSLAAVRPGVHAEVVWYFIAGLAFIIFAAVAGFAYLSIAIEFPVGVKLIGLAWLIFIFFGIGMLAFGLPNLWRAKASVNWPTVNGVIVFSEDQTKTTAIQDGEGDAYRSVTHGVPLAYSYEVNGEKHYANIRHFGQFVAASGNWSDEILERYPTGTNVPVAYCPTDPDLATLEPGIHPEAWFLPGGGAAFLLFGLLALFLSLRR